MASLLNITWEGYEAFLLYDRKLTANPKAIYALKSRFNQLKAYFSNLEFNRDNFVTFIASEKKRGISDSTINKYISNAKNIARYLKISDLADFTYYKERKKDVDCLTWEEMINLAKVEIDYRTSKEGLTSKQQNFRYYCYIKLLTMTGCRMSEAMDLLWSDVHPEYLVFRDTKNSEDRHVPINSAFYNELISLPKLSKTVFNLSALSNTVTNDLKRRAKQLGMHKSIYNHIFRHSVATLLLQNGETAVHIARMLGWRDINTIKRYEHLNLTDITEMMYRSSKVWNEGESFERLTERVKKMVSKMVDLNRYSLTMDLSSNNLSIIVRKSE
jgi:integrase